MSFRRIEGGATPNIHRASVDSEFVWSAHAQHELIDNSQGSIERRPNSQLFYLLLREAWNSDPARMKVAPFDQLLQNAATFRASLGMKPSIHLFSVYMYTYESLNAQLLQAEKKPQNGHVPGRDVTFRLSPTTVSIFDASRTKVRGRTSTDTLTVDYAGYSTEVIGNKRQAAIGRVPVREIDRTNYIFLNKKQELKRGDPLVAQIRKQMKALFSEPIFVSKFIDALYSKSPSIADDLHHLMSTDFQATLLSIDIEDYGELPFSLKSLKLLQILAEDGDQILDLGTGTGASAWWAAVVTRDQPGVQVYGADIYESEGFETDYCWRTTTSAYPKFFAGMEAMGSVTPPKFVRGSAIQVRSDKVIGALPFADQSLDIIVARQVFRYIASDHGKVLSAEIARVLKPGGRVIVSEKRDPEVFYKE